MKEMTVIKICLLKRTIVCDMVAWERPHYGRYLAHKCNTYVSEVGGK